MKKKEYELLRRFVVKHPEINNVYFKMWLKKNEEKLLKEKEVKIYLVAERLRV